MVDTLSASEIVAEMGVGWNLGNALDTRSEDETAWGNPYTTKSLIDAVTQKGFKTLRVPTTWEFHMGPAPSYTIEPEWLDRAEQIVQYGLDNDMYVILNTHHDHWVLPTDADKDQVIDQVKKVWLQIATRFEKYGQRLIFEPFNEPRLIGSAEEWSGGTVEGREAVNSYHQAAVETIRGTGGNNAIRALLICSYAASPAGSALDELVLPQDDNLIVSVHNYYPYNFALNPDAATAQQSWGSEEEKSQMKAEVDRIADIFQARGVPVVMGEWGSLHRGNSADRVEHAAYYTKCMLDRGIVPIVWDDGNRDTAFGLLNRGNYSWTHEDVVDAIIGAQM